MCQLSEYVPDSTVSSKCTKHRFKLVAEPRLMFWYEYECVNCEAICRREKFELRRFLTGDKTVFTFGKPTRYKISLNNGISWRIE